MSRPIVLSNGELHVGLNNFGLVHDFYYPYVGLENHAAGHSLRHHVGVWIDGKISWLDEKGWVFSFGYPHDALIGHTIATNDQIGIRIEFEDTVDAEFSAFMRSIHVINLSATPREVRLFMHQAFVIGDSRSNTDTVQYLPDAHAILHYRGRRAFIVSARTDNKWFDQHAVGLFDIEGHEGTFRDAEDGELSMSSVEHGRVDSTIRSALHLEAHDSARVEYWVACGTSTREALYIHKQLTKSGVSTRMTVAAKWWHDWLAPAITLSQRLPDPLQRSFVESAMIVKSQIDKRGAVIASTDTAMLNYSRDTYAYCWPRDGANVIWPLIRMGYKDEPYRFFDFCRRALNPGGFLMHKYRADGALGSSWHPYSHEHGVVAPPIQEDETALVLFVFSQFYHEHKDPMLMKEFYEPMVVPMANFLASYVDSRTHLPKPSYDLWEERFATFTYTVSVTCAALLAAADLADEKSDEDNAVRWRASAGDIHEAAHKHLYNAERGAFYKSISVTEDGAIEKDETFDMSSLFGAFMFGLYSIDSDEVKRAVATAESLFDISEQSSGVPRYENDSYRRASDRVTGNWWPITSLWLAQYFTDTGDNERARTIIDWVYDRRGESGIMSEQIDPTTKQMVSVAPLTWSHAEYLSTLLDTMAEE